MPMMKVNSNPIVHSEMVEYAVDQEQVLEESKKLDVFLPKKNFEHSSKSSMVAKNISVLSQESLLAYRKFKKTGDLPSGTSVTSALHLLAHASINSNEKLRLLAYKVVLEGIRDNKEAICDLCSLLLLGVSKYANTMSFFSDDMIRELQSKTSQHELSVQYLTLTGEEWEQINTLIQKRFENQGNLGCGPIRCYDFVAYLGNYLPIGLVYKTIARETPLTLQVLEGKDVHVLSLYAESLKNNKFLPKDVTDINDTFNMSFNELTISKGLFNASTRLQDLVKKLQNQNSNLIVTFVDDAFAKQHPTIAVYPFYVFS